MPAGCNNIVGPIVR